MDRVLEFLAERWGSDLTKQWSSVVSSFAPIQHGAKISKGVIDLIRYPARQLVQRGSVLAGVRQGVQSFRRTTAPASLDMLSQLIQLVIDALDPRPGPGLGPGAAPPAQLDHRTGGAATAAGRLNPNEANARHSTAVAAQARVAPVLLLPAHSFDARIFFIFSDSSIHYISSEFIRFGL